MGSWLPPADITTRKGHTTKMTHPYQLATSTSIRVNIKLQVIWGLMRILSLRCYFPACLNKKWYRCQPWNYCFCFVLCINIRGLSFWQQVCLNPRSCISKGIIDMVIDIQHVLIVFYDRKTTLNEQWAWVIVVVYDRDYNDLQVFHLWYGKMLRLKL